jgi:hypothetical protein
MLIFFLEKKSTLQEYPCDPFLLHHDHTCFKEEWLRERVLGVRGRRPFLMEKKGEDWMIG